MTLAAPAAAPLSASATPAAGAPPAAAPPHTAGKPTLPSGARAAATAAPAGAPPANGKPAAESPAPDALHEAPPKPDVKREVEFARREAELTRREREAKSALSKAQDSAKLIEQFQADPFGTIRKLGGDPEKALELFARDGKKTPEMELAELKAWREAEEQRKAEEAKQRDQQTRQQRLEQARGQVRSHVDAGGEEFEMISLHDAHDDVLEYAATVYRQGDPQRGLMPGTDLTIDQACRHVEDFLWNQRKQRFQGSKKLQGLFAPATAAEEPAAVEATPPAVRAKPPSSLSNRKAAAPPAPPGPPRRMSRTEEIDDVIRRVRAKTKR